MFIPIRDDQPTIRTPHVTIALILLNTVIFLISQTLGAKGYASILTQYGYIPELFLDFGAHYIAPSWIYGTPITSMFLHGGWMHLIGNMLFLWIFGNNIEDYFGPIRFLLFYLVSGLAAIALYTVFNPDSTVPLVGASGAIAGVMGAYFVLHPRARITVLIIYFLIMVREFPAKVVLGIWFGFQVLMSLFGGSGGGGVAFLAHVGGFILGWALLKLLIRIKGGRGSTPSGGQRVYRIHW
ncbi:MAG: rhomboid family intramembrane serine protease [candidate division Zixibacteria bacterium]|nr:rhomboid family intramembrane serine protease [candidate division Zixibacteria bacterium]